MNDVESLILASASPRRHQLLRSIGLQFEVVPADIDENELPGESALVYVERVAVSKARAVVERMSAERLAGVTVLAADTTVDLDGAILAKPADDDEAHQMLRSLAGRTHQVHTAVAGWSSAGSCAVTVTTDVTFIELDDERIAWYLSFGEHRDKAGAYGMQGAAGAFVSRISGSPSNVIGLPLAETVEVLRVVGWPATPSP